MSVPVALIVAVARNGVIGLDGGMPWHLPGDLAHFQRLTTGHPIVMGRRTWESLPRRPLKNRTNIVVSSQHGLAEAAGGLTVTALPTALDLGVQHAAPGGTVFVIGGARIFAEALPLAQRIYWTEVAADPPGDTFFPGFDRSLWRESARAPGDGCTYLTLDRIAEES